jgi:hypothetical protein
MEDFKEDALNHLSESDEVESLIWMVIMRTSTELQVNV